MPDDNPTGKPITRESVRPMSRSGGDLTALTVAAVANTVEKALSPGCFFLVPGCRLRVRHEPREEIPWELFAGHLHYVHPAGVEYVKDGWRLLSVRGGRRAATRKDLRDPCIIMPPVIDSASR